MDVKDDRRPTTVKGGGNKSVGLLRAALDPARANNVLFSRPTAPNELPPVVETCIQQVLATKQSQDIETLIQLACINPQLCQTWIQTRRLSGLEVLAHAKEALLDLEKTLQDASSESQIPLGWSLSTGLYQCSKCQDPARICWIKTKQKRRADEAPHTFVRCANPKQPQCPNRAEEGAWKLNE